MLSYNPTLMIPWGYGTTKKSLYDVHGILNLHYHPEFTRRLLAWLTAMNGGVGIGGHFRPDGTQPDKPGFAPEGKSFHQNQQYNDGFIGATAVDVVVLDPRTGKWSSGAVPWSVVPKQGTSSATLRGIHANISTEAWHIQPIEIDGHDSWVKAGRPAPKLNYPIPVYQAPSPIIPKEANVLLFKVRQGDSYWKICELVTKDGKATPARVKALQAANGNRALHPGDLVSIPGRVDF